MLSLILTGVATGFVGYLVFGKLLSRYLLQASPVGEFAIIVAIAVLIMAGGLISFAEFISQAFGLPRFFTYLIMAGSLFSLPTLAIIIVVWQMTSIGGHGALKKFATDAIGPFVSLFVAFLLGATHATSGNDSLFAREFQLEIAAFSMIFDFWRGIIAGGIAFVTEKLISRFAP